MKIQLPSLLVQRISAAWRVWIHERSHWSYAAYSHHAAALADEKGVLGVLPRQAAWAHFVRTNAVLARTTLRSKV